MAESDSTTLIRRALVDLARRQDPGGTADPAGVALALAARMIEALIALAVGRRVQALGQTGILRTWPDNAYKQLRAARAEVQAWFEALRLPYTDL